MREILADLVAEQQALDQLLAARPDRDWKRATRPRMVGAGHDQPLAATEEHAGAPDRRRGLRAEVVAAGGIDAFNQAGVELAAPSAPGGDRVVAPQPGGRRRILSRTPRQTRVGWYAGPMSVRTFATTRLMETWAHGLDIVAALKRDVADTPRMRHVACWAGRRCLCLRPGGEKYPARSGGAAGAGYGPLGLRAEESEQVVRGRPRTGAVSSCAACPLLGRQPGRRRGGGRHGPARRPAYI